nr:hypothetical protein [Kutzneria chonburiensis]
MGKTTLAIRSAHALKTDFPDGQLFVNLRGYDLRQPLATTQVLAMFLRALGVPADQIPPDEPGLVSRYRAECAGRRLLVVLDNASSAAQVHPLLLDSPSAAHLITSRDLLRELTDPLQLDVLPAADSLALLGPDITSAAPEAAAEVTELCGHLPLALRIVVGNLPDHSPASIAAYATELRGQRRIDALEILDEEKTGVRTAFDLSYAALDAPARRLFTLLSVVPGQDFTPALAAAIGDIPVSEATAQLTRLATANLLHEHVPDRFQFHDLIRAYAANKSESDESPQAVDSASERMLDHYLHSVDNGTSHLGRSMPRLPCPPPPPSARPLEFENVQLALQWFTEEISNLVSVAQFAATFHTGWHGWQLTNALLFYFHTRVGPQHDWTAVARAGIAAAECDGHTTGLAEAHRVLAISLRPWLNAGWDIDDLGAQALSHLTKSIALYREAQDAHGIPNTISNYAIVLHDLGRMMECIGYFREAVQEAVTLGSKRAEITARANLASALGEVGRLSESTDMHLSTLDAARRIGHHATETRILMSLGDMAFWSGAVDKAIAYFTNALKMATSLSLDNMRYNIQAQLIWSRTIKTLALTDDDRTILDHIAADVDSIDALAAVAGAYLDSGDLDAAGSLLERLAANIQKKRPQYYDSVVLCDLARARLLTGDLAAAESTASTALTISRAIPSLVSVGRSLTTLATIAMRKGDRQQAEAAAIEALTVHRETGHRPGEAETLALLGDLCDDDEYRRQAAELYAEMGISPRGR